MNIYEQFYNSQKYGKVYDENNIYDFVSYYCDKLKLGNSIQRLAFLETEEEKNALNAPAGYLSDNTIVVDYNKMLTEALRIYNINPKKCTALDLTSINLLIINFLFHEIVHAKQYDMINGFSKGNIEMLKIFKDCFEKSFDPNIYTFENHDFFITEYNANIEGALLTDSFYDDLVEMYTDRRNTALYEFVPIFIEDAYDNLSPLENYNKITNQNIKPLERLDSFDKLCYGMPLNENELQKAKTLQYAKDNNINIKNYMKSKKN